MQFISVSEVGSDESSGRAVWRIQHVMDNVGQATLTSLTYGEVPKGWSEVKKAEHLLPNVYYSINDEYYFVRDTNYKYSVLSREQYFSRRLAVSTQR